MFREHGVEITSLNEDFDTSGSMGRAMLHIIMVFAQLERELIGERTRSVMQGRIERGLSNGGIKWGYRHDPTQNGRLVPDAEWGPIVREHFFDSFDRLGSAGAVQRHLAELGIVVPRRNSPDGKVRGGKMFTKQQVVRVLTSEIYLGTLAWGDVRKAQCHEPLISQEQFDRVQKVLDRNRKTITSRDPQGAYPFLLKGIVRCKCGSMMTSYFSTGHLGTMHFYYVCTNRTHRGKKGCDAPYVPAAALDDAIVKRVMELSGDQQAQDTIVRMAIGMAGDDVRRVRGEADQVRRRQSDVQSEINNLVRALSPSVRARSKASGNGFRNVRPRKAGW
jgi:site-specific DNA recombinase